MITTKTDADQGCTKELPDVLGWMTFAAVNCWAWAMPFAHPLADRAFDRAIQVTIGDGRVAVSYSLGVNDLTLLTELLGLVEPGQAPASPAAARAQYAKVVQPILARGLCVRIDGVERRLDALACRINLIDHVQYIFTFETALEPAQGFRKFSISDGNFPGERGYRRLAIQATGHVRLRQSTVASTVDSIPLKPTWELPPEVEDKMGQGEAEFEYAIALPTSPSPRTQGTSPNPSAQGPPGWDLRELLARNNLGFAVALALAFVFGMLHAIKPGHGKTMVAAYLVGQQGTVYHAALLGVVTTLTHTGTVLFVAFMLRPMAGARFVEQQTLSFWLTLISGAAIVWLGGALLWRRARGREDLLHVHGPGGHVHLPDGSVQWESRASIGSLLTLGISGGLIPCDDAVLLLLAAIGAGMLAEAVFILLAFSAGLASVLVLIGILVVKLRGFAAASSHSQRMVRWLQTASALAIVAIGVGLCASAFRI